MSVTHDTPDIPCPVCDYVTNRARSTHEDASTPTDGDFTVCINCACILVYDSCDDCGGMLLRLPRPHEAIDLEDDDPEVAKQLAQVQGAIMRTNAERTPGWRPPWIDYDA